MSSITNHTRDDDDYEVAEEFSIELRYGHGIRIDDIMDKVSVVVLSDEQGKPGQVSFATTDFSLLERETRSIKLKRENGHDGKLRVSVSLNTPNGSSDDLELPNTNIIFKNGQTEAFVTIKATDDQTIENSETIQLVLTADDDAYLGQRYLNITINDNDQPQQSQTNRSGGSISFLWLMFGLVLIKLKSIK